MSSESSKHTQEQLELLHLYAIEALPPREKDALKAHLNGCAECRNELAALRGTVQKFAAWPRDVVRPSGSLRERLADRIAAETGKKPVLPPSQWVEPDWEEVAPGISCKILATDHFRDRVTMLVRLAPGTNYPPHTHAGVEELHLLEGELMIDDRKLHPGDYNRGEPGTSDSRVWSETGCTCVLVTSLSDRLR
jgi:anti-sigma factor ChrR (cupin superfamily)